MLKIQINRIKEAYSILRRHPEFFVGTFPYISTCIVVRLLPVAVSVTEMLLDMACTVAWFITALLFTIEVTHMKRKQPLTRYAKMAALSGLTFAALVALQFIAVKLNWI